MEGLYYLCSENKDADQQHGLLMVGLFYVKLAKLPSNYYQMHSLLSILAKLYNVRFAHSVWYYKHTATHYTIHISCMALFNCEPVCFR